MRVFISLQTQPWSVVYLFFRFPIRFFSAILSYGVCIDALNRGSTFTLTRPRKVASMLKRER